MNCDSPLNNVNKEACKEFMKKHTGRSVPDQSTLRKYKVSEIYNKIMKELRRKHPVKNCGFLWTKQQMSISIILRVSFLAS